MDEINEKYDEFQNTINQFEARKRAERLRDQDGGVLEMGIMNIWYGDKYDDEYCEDCFYVKLKGNVKSFQNL